jgi:hypothetical protein
VDVIEFLKGIAINLIWAILAWFAARIYVRARIRRRARELWPFHDFEHFMIIVARTEDAETGKYKRPQTGIGELRALALLAPSLDKASKKTDFQDVKTANELGTGLTGDLIVLGGPKNNELTRRLLAQPALAQLLGNVKLEQQGSAILWGDNSYEGNTDGDVVSDDYGLVVRMNSPFASHRTVVLLSGSHTYGVIAAAAWYAASERDRKSLPRSGSGFAALVRTEVFGHMVSEPQLVASVKFPN